MKLLITGHTGFLGKRLCYKLDNIGIHYVGYDRKEYGSLTENNLGYFFRDNKGFSHIIHLAAKVGGIGANKKRPYSFIYDNLLMGLNLINKAINFAYYDLDRIKFIMIGTVCSYPCYTPVPFKEENMWDGFPEKTNAPYGIAKKTLMEVLRAANEQCGLKSTILNMANLYGPGDSNNLQTSHVIPAIFNKCKEILDWKKSWSESRWPFLNLWGDGKATRDFLHVDDACDAIIKSLYLEQGPVNGINVGTGVETSIESVAHKILDIMSVPKENIIWNTDMENGQPRRVLDVSRAKELLNWESKISLDDGLRDLAKEYL